MLQKEKKNGGNEKSDIKNAYEGSIAQGWMLYVETGNYHSHRARVDAAALERGEAH